MSGDNKKKIEMYVDPETYDAIDSIRRSSLERRDMWDLSLSESARELVEHGLDSLGDNSALEELVDDLDLEVYRKQREQDRLQKAGRIAEMTGGWRGRVVSRISRRLAGPEPYPVEEIRELAELYWREIKNWEDDEEALLAHRDWLDRKLAEYERALEAKTLYPDQDLSDVDDAARVGSDLLDLRPRIEEVVETIQALGDRDDLSHADAIRSRLATEYNVSEDAIDVVLDYLTPEDVSPSEALRSGDEIGDLLPDSAIEEPEVDVAALNGSVRKTNGDCLVDDHVERAQLVVDEDDLAEIDDELGIDGDELRALIGGDRR